MNKDVNKYLKDIKSLLPDFAEEKHYYDNLRILIEKETKNNPHMTYEDCVEQYGHPKDILIHFYEESDGDFIVERVRKQQLSRNIFNVVFGCVVVLAFIAIFLIFMVFLRRSLL